MWEWRHDIQHNDTQHNDTEYKFDQHNNFRFELSVTTLDAEFRYAEHRSHLVPVYSVIHAEC
jgi:hypothetical protein